MNNGVRSDDVSVIYETFKIYQQMEILCTKADSTLRFRIIRVDQIRIVTPSTRVDLIRIRLKISVDANKKTPWKRNMISGAYLESLFIKLMLRTENFLCHEKNHSRYSLEFGRIARDRKSMIVDSSEERSARRTHVGRRKTHKDPKLLDEIWRKEWRRCPKKSGREARQRLDTEKPKLQTARRLRGIDYIASDDTEFDTVTKNARRILETHMESAMQCKAQKKPEQKTLNNSMSTSRREPCAETQLADTSCCKQVTGSNTVHAHKIDAYESRSCGIDESGKHKHEEHIARR